MKKIILVMFLLLFTASCGLTLNEEKFNKGQQEVIEHKEFQSRLVDFENKKVKLEKENNKILEQKSKIENEKQNHAVLEATLNEKAKELTEQKLTLQKNKGYMVLNNQRFNYDYMEFVYDNAPKGTIVVIEPETFYADSMYGDWHVLKNYYVFDYDKNLLFGEILVKGNLPKKSDFKKTIYLKYLKRERPEAGVRQYLFFEFLGYTTPKSVQNKMSILNKKQKEINEIDKKIEKIETENELYREKEEKNNLELNILQDQIVEVNDVISLLQEQLKEKENNLSTNYNKEKTNLDDSCFYKNQEYSNYKECLKG